MKEWTVGWAEQSEAQQSGMIFCWATEGSACGASFYSAQPTLRHN